MQRRNGAILDWNGQSDVMAAILENVDDAHISVAAHKNGWDATLFFDNADKVRAFAQELIALSYKLEARRAALEQEKS